MLRVGVIGVGVMGKNHVRLYSQMNCELVGISDINQELAKEMGERYGVKYYTNYHDLIPKVDAVSIAVPTVTHHSVAMDCLREGIHCLVEKPIAFNLHEADEMINEAEKNKLILAVGHIENHNPAVKRLKEIIDTGLIGKPLIISTRRIGPFDPRVRDVGVVIDLAPHDIGVIKYLIGKEPVGTFSQTGSFILDKDDYAIIVLDFIEATACIELNWCTPHKVRTLVLTGSEGIANLNYIDQSLILQNSSINEEINIQKAEPLKIELEDFLLSIVEKKKPWIDGREARSILKIALECSHNSGSNSLKI